MSKPAQFLTYQIYAAGRNQPVNQLFVAFPKRLLQPVVKFIHVAEHLFSFNEKGNEFQQVFTFNRVKFLLLIPVIADGARMGMKKMGKGFLRHFYGMGKRIKQDGRKALAGQKSPLTGLLK